jgi:hypothetical protein
MYILENQYQNPHNYVFNPSVQSNAHTCNAQCCLNSFRTWMVLGTSPWSLHFCRYWNVLHMQVKTSVLTPLLQLLCNTYFCSEIFWTPQVSILDSQLLCCDLLEKLQVINTGIGLFSMVRFNFIHVCKSFYHPMLPQTGL